MIERILSDPYNGYRFVILVEKEKSCYTARCPDIGGIYEEGDTKKEAIENAIKAAQSVIVFRNKNGERKKVENKLALAKVGIIALIDESTGYQKERFKDKKALKKIYNKFKKEK